MGTSKLFDVADFEGYGREKSLDGHMFDGPRLHDSCFCFSFFLLVGDEFYATLPIFSKGEKLVN
jgi:hypothetical protein